MSSAGKGEFAVSNRKRIASIAFTGVAAAAAGMNAAPAAAATGSWHVSPPNSTHFSGTNLNTATFQFYQSDELAVPFKCKARDASVSGQVSVNGNQLFTISEADFGRGATALSCSIDELGFTVGITRGAAPWVVKGSSYNAATDVAKLAIANVSLSINNKASAGWPASEGCHVVVTNIGTGSALPGSFKNASHRFAIDTSHRSALRVTSVGTTKATSCLGILKTGDKAWFSASYSTSPALTVTAGP
jgi:hypothetical protein